MTIAERPHDLESPLEHEVDPSVIAELAEHRGQWVAMTRSRLLATGATPTEVVNAARAQGVSSPIVYRVPEDGHRSYFF